MRDKLGRFKKGCKSWNEGTEGIMKSNKGSFKKGHTPTKTVFKKDNIPWNKNRKYLQISGKNHWNWKDGKTISRGYLYLKKPNHPFCDHYGYIKRSRFTVEKIIRRYLKRTESVHHLGKKNDDRPHMLMAFTSESAHQRFHKNPNNVKPEEIIFDGRLL